MTYQKDPFITDIEITVYDIRNYDAGGDGSVPTVYLLEDLDEVIEVLNKVNDKRQTKDKSNSFIAGEKLIAEMEKVDPGSYSKKEDLEPEEI